MSKIPTILTYDESDRLLNAIRYPLGPESQTRTSFRNYLMALFMLDAGLRVSEVIQLRRFMIFADTGAVHTLKVTPEIAKNHTPRYIPLSERLKKEIESLHNYIWINNPETSLRYVFFTNDSEKHITARRVQQIINTAGTATIGRKVWPHVLRHTFATRLMRVTNTRIVQELLGHKKISSTQIYTHPNSQDLHKAIAEM